MTLVQCVGEQIMVVRLGRFAGMPVELADTRLLLVRRDDAPQMVPPFPPIAALRRVVLDLGPAAWPSHVDGDVYPSPDTKPGDEFLRGILVAADEIAASGHAHYLGDPT